MSSISEAKSIKDVNIDISPQVNSDFELPNENVNDTHRVYENQITGDSPFRDFQATYREKLNGAEDGSQIDSVKDKDRLEQFQRAKDMVNNRVNKFSDQMEEQDKGGTQMMVGRSLSKYSCISKISMNQAAGPSRDQL